MTASSASASATSSATPIAVLVSGRGSNLQALLTDAAQADAPYRVGLVLCNRPDAHALQRAARAGVPTQVLDHRGYPDRAAFDAALDAALRSSGCEHVVLAGFMRILTAGFVQAWQGRLLNIHPSLLPRHPGLDTHARALAAGDAEHGCSVHFVTPEVDGGPVVAQAATRVQHHDTGESLAARVLRLEHRLLPAVVREWVGGRLLFTDHAVLRDGVPLDPATVRRELDN